jgi:hypothetical protein
LGYVKRGNGRRSVMLSALIGLLLIMGSGGCAGTTRDDSIELAKSGATLAGAAQANLAEIRTSLDRYNEGQFLEAELTARPLPTTQQIESIRRIQRAIVLRERALADMGTLYLTLQRLGEYDAAAAAETQSNDLIDSVNAFGSAVGSDKPILTHVESGFLAKGAGLLAGRAQAATIRSASVEIRSTMERFRDHLRAQQAFYDSMRDTIAKGQSQVAQALYAKGIGNPTLVFREMLATYGLDYNEAEAAAALKSLGGEGRKAMGNVIAYRSETSVALEASILQSTIGGMNALIEQHQKLERGESLSLTGLRRELALLEGLVEDYVRWRQLDEQSRNANAASATTKPS